MSTVSVGACGMRAVFASALVAVYMPLLSTPLIRVPLNLPEPRNRIMLLNAPRRKLDPMLHGTQLTLKNSVHHPKGRILKLTVTSPMSRLSALNMLNIARRSPLLNLPRPTSQLPALNTSSSTHSLPKVGPTRTERRIPIRNLPRLTNQSLALNTSILGSLYPITHQLVLNPPKLARQVVHNPPGAAEPLRIYRGVDDTIGKYAYVVTLLGKKKMRTCTGTLIAPTWVLTAAHCDIGVHVQYGDMTVPRANITTTRKIQKVIPHPNYRDYNYVATGYTYNDIAMILIQEVPLTTFGVLSGVDYRTLVGCEVEYAGLGITDFNTNKTIDFMRPVRLGFGMVRSCKDLKSHNYPEICVAHKCTLLQSAMRGDSGGPLFFDGKVVGVNAALYFKPLTTICTPVSPYISWIQEVMEIENRR